MRGVVECADLDAVVAKATFDKIGALTADKRVVPFTPHDGVIVDAAIKEIIPVATIDGVVVILAIDNIIAVTRENAVITVIEDGVVRATIFVHVDDVRAIRHIGAKTAIDRVVVIARIDRV